MNASVWVAGLAFALSAAWAAEEATLCQERQNEVWQVEDGPDYAAAFQGVDFSLAPAAEAPAGEYRARYLVRDGERLTLVSMGDGRWRGTFRVCPVTGLRPDGRVLTDRAAERYVCLPDLYQKLLDVELPEGYAPSSSEAGAEAEAEFYAVATLSSRAAVELRARPGLRRALSQVEEADKLHAGNAGAEFYVDVVRDHVLLGTASGEPAGDVQFSHYEARRDESGAWRLAYVASTRFDFGFASIGEPCFSSDFRFFLLPLDDEELGVRTTLRLPAQAFGGVTEFSTGYRDGLSDESTATDALVHELLLGRYGNALLMLRGGKVDAEAPDASGLRPLDLMPPELRALAPAAGERAGGAARAEKR